MAAAPPEQEWVRLYADRSQLISDLVGLLKASRRCLDPESASLWHSGPTGSLFLDSEGSGQLERLTVKLLRHRNFEYLSADDAKKALCNAIAAYQTGYRNGQRTPIKEIAAAFLDDTARPICHGRVYVGMRHLRLPGAIEAGLARFIPAKDVAFLEEIVGRESFEECGVYCIVEATGATSSKIIDRAEQAALLAGSFLRLHLRRSSRDILDEELLFDFHPMYAMEIDGGRPLRGGHRRFGPMDLDLSHYDSSWTRDVEEEGRRITALSAPFRKRVDTALEWMDVAARAPTWKTQIPAIFFGIESLLVPEDCGHKAEVVTVRSVILQAMLSDWFSHPDDTYFAYRVRCDLVHGEPIEEAVTDDIERLADRCSWWAGDIITAYITHASTMAVSSAEALVRGLDQSDTAAKACQWFLDHGADELVRDYREAIGLQPFQDRT